MTVAESLPSWIELPPTSSPPPPITGLADELPLASLSWPDFERLCLRLARTQTDVVSARIYGIPGQEQHGIDLFARIGGTDLYRVYQCKRVQEFSPSVIRAAVESFRQGEWASRSQSLVVCTSDSVRTVQRTEEVERQTERLAGEKVELVVWAREDISDLLRVHPEIVFEFFGLPWVERFCGSPALAEIRSRKLLLGPSEVCRFRGQLAKLYRNVFATHDPGLVVSQQQSPLHLYDRFVVPDLLLPDGLTEERDSAEIPSPLDDSFSWVDDTGAANPVLVVGQRRRRSPGASNLGRRSGTRGQRISLEHFFAGETDAKFVILAGPGGGKSALLRFIALDLLNESPQLVGLTSMWGRFLPVWIPFGAWAEQTERAGRVVSLSDMLRYWLALFDESELWPLVESALNDSRLLLLVDGLDEWTTENSARIALAQLNVFAAQRGTPIILTSRPHGFQQLAVEFPTWKIGEIAPLTRSQQRDLAKAWFVKWIVTDASFNEDPSTASSVDQHALQAAREFIEDLSKQSDLDDLASVPLLLSVFILLRYQHASLPDDRFSAYQALSEQLISIWPRKRRAAALVGSDVSFELSDNEREQTYAYLAFRMHTGSSSGAMGHADARRFIEEFLSDDTSGLGFPDADAKRGARELLQIGQSVSGILVARSPRHLGFYHRAIQEYLVAKHLATLPFEEQLRHIRERVSDVLWREVVLAFLTMLRATTAVANVVDAIREIAAASSVPDSFHLRELLTEVAVGPITCPPTLSRELAEEAIGAISQSWWMPHRERLLRLLLGGLRIRRLRPLLIPQIRRWFPERVAYRGTLLREITAFPEQEIVKRVLIENLLFDDNASVQIEAARVISRHKELYTSLREELVEMARLPLSPKSRAAVLLTLLEGNYSELDALLWTTGNSLVPEIRLIQLNVLLRRGERNQGLAKELLDLTSYVNGVTHYWVDIIVKVASESLKGDTFVRDECIRAIERNAARDERAAWDILLRGFPQDEEVARAVADRLTGRPHAYHIDPWLLSENFRDNPILVEALDRWLSDDHEQRLPLVAGAALVGRTEIAKLRLLQSLSGPHPFWAVRALLDGWGMDDNGVNHALLALAAGPNSRAALVAHLLPRIIPDPDSCYVRLLELLNDDSVTRADFVISGLASLGRVKGNPEVVEAVLRRVAAKPDNMWSMIAQVVEDAPEAAGVLNLVLAQLEAPDAPFASIIRVYGNNPEVKRRCLEFLSPLPASLRLLIAEYIRDLRGADPDVTEICRECWWDLDPEVATAGSIAYARRRRVSEGVLDEDVSRLREQLLYSGDLDERSRQAAAAALVEYQRAEMVRDTTEPLASHLPLHVPVSDGLRVNWQLIDLLLQHWDYLEDVFSDADSILARFRSRFYADPAHVWEWLAPSLDEYATPSRLLLELCDKIPDAEIGPNTLLFLARQRPRTMLLRETCMRVLRRPITNWVQDPRAWEVAADVLARQFSDDAQLWEDISRSVGGDNLNYGELVALCRARPDASVLEKLNRRTKELTGFPLIAYYRLVFAAATTESLQEAAVSYLENSASNDSRVRAWLYRPLLERLRRDDILAGVLENRRREAPEEMLATTILSVTRSISSTVSHEQIRAEMHRELSRIQEDGSGAALGLNLRTGEVLPRIHLLLDTLERLTR